MVNRAQRNMLNIVEEQIRLLLVDDEVQVRRGLSMAFSAEPDLKVIGEAEDGECAVALAHELRPDVVIMDLRLRTLDGLSATRRIHERDPDIRVVVLTLLDDRLTRSAAAAAGALGFVGKGEGSERLVSTIRTVARAS
jgi:DNA-binding NarL/FixJ family response regulator